MKRMWLAWIGLAVGALAAVPQVRVTAGAEPVKITFDFATDVVETEAGYTHEPLLACAPTLNAVYAFEKRNRVVMLPTAALQAGTRYRCVGKAAPFADQNLSFSAPPFAVLQIRRLDVDVFRIEFNDAVDVQTLRSALQIRKRERMAEVSIAYDVTVEGPAAVVRLKESVGEADLRLTVDSACTSRSGATLQQSTAETFTQGEVYTPDPDKKTLQVFDAPRFVALPYGKLGIRFFFADYGTARSLRTHLNIDGARITEVSDDQYIGYYERRRLKLSDKSDYYVDVEADFTPGQRYVITLTRGLETYYTQLRDDLHYTVTIGDRMASLQFESDKPYVASQGEIGIESVNVPKMTMVVERLLDQNYRYFLAFSEGEESLIDRLGKQVHTQTFELDGGINSFERRKLPLGPLMEQWGSGIYRLSLHYGDHQRADKVIFVSDIGITAKRAADQLLVSAARLSDAAAIGDATVRIYSARNELLGEGKTDPEGICILDKIATEDAVPVAVEVVTETGHNFLLLDRSLDPVPDVSDAPHDRLKAYVYQQSLLVRPGERASMLIALRDREYRAQSALPLRVIVRDPDYKRVYDAVHRTDAKGAFDLVLPISTAQRTGRYNVSVLLADHTIGTGHFNVETFMPQKIHNTITVKTPVVRNGGVLEATFGSDYLFGAPAAGLKAEARLSAVAVPYTNAAYPGYSFTDTRQAQSGAIVYLDQKREFYLDARGKHDTLFAVQAMQRPPSILRAQLGLTVFDDGQPVSTYTDVSILPFARMAGVRLSDPSIKENEEAQIATVLLDPMTGTEHNRTLDVTIERFRWQYHRNADGNWVWHKVYEPVSRMQVMSGGTIRGKMPGNGDYLITVSEPFSGHRASTMLTVSGWDYTPISPTSDFGRVDLRFEDKTYKPGDVIHADVRSPIMKGRLLITLERDRILWHRVIDIDRGSASLDIPVTEDLGRGAYLCATIVRSTEKAAGLIPYRAHSAIAVRADRSRHRLTPRIESAQETGSRRGYPITVATAPGSDVLVSVVDRGILQILGQMPPRPFEFFHVLAPRRIGTFDLYDRVIHFLTEGALLAFGGDDAAMLAKAKKHLAPETGAKRVKPFVYWSGIRKADGNGTVRVTVPVGAFNGEAQIVAIALDDDRVGAAYKNFKVRDDVMLKPQFPRFAHAGDILRVPLRLFNTTAAPVDVNLSVLASPNVTLFDIPTHLRIAANDSTLSAMTLLADAPGRTEVNLTIRSGADTLSYPTALPITWSYPLRTKVFSGETDSRTTVTIPPRYFSTGNPRLYVTLSDSLLSRLKDDADDLIGYPYGCAEQTASKLLAMAELDPFAGLQDPRFRTFLQEDRARFIREGIDKLSTLQYNDGRFAYWKQGGAINAYASVYAGDVLLHLRDKGYKVDDGMTGRIYKSLTRLAKGYDGADRFIRLYSAWLLSRAGRLDTSLGNALYDQGIYKQGLVTRYMMAAILHRSGATAARNDIFGQLESTSITALPHARSLGGHFYSRAREIAFALFIHLDTFQKNRFSERLRDALAKTLDHLYSTQEKAFVLRALVKYYGDRTPQPLQAAVTIDGATCFADKPHTYDATPTEANVTLKAIGGATVHYSIEASQYLPEAEQPSAKQLAVQRHYVNRDGMPVDMDTITVGDLFYSRVTLSGHEPTENVAVVDRIPACFEIVNERTDRMRRSEAVRNSRNFRPDYQDYRDDRVLTFLDVPQDSVTYYTPLRAVAAGRCLLPALIAEAMYDPRIRDEASGADAVQVRSVR